MIPDRRIVRKLKAYDRNLFVKWNDRHEYFELWMKHWMGGSRLITPVTRSIYADEPKVYTELDERLLMWVYHADTARTSKHGYIETLKAWKAFESKMIKNRRDDNRHRAAELFHSSRNFYMQKGKQKLKQDTPGVMKPDMQSTVRNRLFQRSKQNAKQYNYRPPE